MLLHVSELCPVGDVTKVSGSIRSAAQTPVIFIDYAGEGVPHCSSWHPVDLTLPSGVSVSTGK